MSFIKPPASSSCSFGLVAINRVISIFCSLSSSAVPGLLRPGLKPRDFKFVTVLGEGAFGRVKLARHVQSKEVYALKCMSKAKVVRMKQTRNVVSERKLLGALDHPFILKLYAALKDRALAQRDQAQQGPGAAHYDEEEEAAEEPVASGRRRAVTWRAGDITPRSGFNR